MAAPTNLTFDLVKAEEVSDAIIIEQEGFPPDEAGSLDKFKFRQEQAPDLFLGAFILQNDSRKIIGYICSTLSSSETLTHESMSEHAPGASTICIHSICVQKSLQGKGIAMKLLKEYVSRLRTRAEAGSVPYKRIVLISHENLIPFYENAGFKNLGKSGVVHGSLPWYELRVDLIKSDPSILGTTAPTTTSLVSTIDVAAMPPAQQGSQQIPAGLWEALSRDSSRKNRPTGKPLVSFENGLDDVIASAGEGTSTNKFDLLCLRPGCGSIILKAGVATWVERASEQVSG
ncbi:acyl-CoA N-acyltransferase [Macrolepiota fuliginosa MF-IS2]|uniref:Acyl-CoA N-acyltransferase n=1 Tax=Macrolepiota fuliginosa MF-IS2 TaxID=1400762 RepID=A0A9P5XIL9_9AGAR|nr:acyl-CoA N-acyltransferase [Macrolepiota fuliginosa MF-IS2]